MILITTAGKVGAEAARLLAAQNEPVRLLARHRRKPQHCRRQASKSLRVT